MISDVIFPLEASSDQAQTAIVATFTLLEDWSERYQYLMDLGRRLPDFPAQWKTQNYRLHGCQSQVWIVPEGDAQRIDFHAISDSAIVSGLIYLILRIYSGRSAEEIVQTPAWCLAQIGLTAHLSTTRSQGMASFITFIQSHAQRVLDQPDYPLASGHEGHIER